MGHVEWLDDTGKSCPTPPGFEPYTDPTILGIGNVTLPVRNLGNGWSWGVRFTIQLLYEWGKNFCLPLNKSAGEPQSRSEYFEKGLLLLPAVTPLFSGFPVRNLVTTLTVAYSVQKLKTKIILRFKIWGFPQTQKVSGLKNRQRQHQCCDVVQQMLWSELFLT
jgi:hypothetical protein